LIVLTMPAHAQSTYTRTVTCKGTVVGSGFSWSWQLADSSTVAGGSRGASPRTTAVLEPFVPTQREGP
jgi:hypothetical protein